MSELMDSGMRGKDSLQKRIHELEDKCDGHEDDLHDKKSTIYNL